MMILIKFGLKYKDKVTGFEGIAVSRCTYIDYPPQIALQSSELVSGIPTAQQWFYETMLTEVKDGPGIVAGFQE